MSKEYDEYIKEHCANVRKGFYWIKRSLPEVLIDIPGVDYELNMLDSSGNIVEDNWSVSAQQYLDGQTTSDSSSDDNSEDSSDDSSDDSSEDSSDDDSSYDDSSYDDSSYDDSSDDSYE